AAVYWDGPSPSRTSRERSRGKTWLPCHHRKLFRRAVISRSCCVAGVCGSSRRRRWRGTSCSCSDVPNPALRPAAPSSACPGRRFQESVGLRIVPVAREASLPTTTSKPIATTLLISLRSTHLSNHYVLICKATFTRAPSCIDPSSRTTPSSLLLRTTLVYSPAPERWSTSPCHKYCRNGYILGWAERRNRARYSRRLAKATTTAAA
ncbi:hypothetical protein B0T14DRAFT_600793, partial [Immersiella caudata]